MCPYHEKYKDILNFKFIQLQWYCVQQYSKGKMDITFLLNTMHLVMAHLLCHGLRFYQNNLLILQYFKPYKDVLIKNFFVFENFGRDSPPKNPSPLCPPLSIMKKSILLHTSFTMFFRAKTDYLKSKERLLFCRSASNNSGR